MGQVRGVIALAAAAAALVAGPAAPARAAVESQGGFKYVTENFKLKPGKPSTFKAECPGNTQVLGGGHYNTGTYGDVIGLHNYPYDDGDNGKVPDNGWAAQLRGFGEKFKVKVYAICSGLKPEYLKTSFTVEQDSAPQGAGLSCEGPVAEPISGGSQGTPKAREIENRSFMGSWSLQVVYSGETTEKLKAFAICVNTPVLDGASAPIPGESQGSAIAECPPEAPNVVGGGVYPSDESNAVAIAATQPVAGSDSPFGGWRGWLDNYNVFQITVVAHAYCLPDR
jgi:hypothetical protein